MAVAGWGRAGMKDKEQREGVDGMKNKAKAMPLL